MTSIETNEVKAVIATPVSIYSKPFDVTAKDNAKIAADNAAIAAKKAQMEVAVENKIEADVTCHPGP